MNFLRLMASSSVMAITMITAVPAIAQDKAAPAAADAAVSDSDIIVTARRTQERLQDVPIAIAAFTPTTLERKAVRDVYDLQQATPGISVSPTQSQGRASGGFNIRGQRQAADDAPPGVVTYLNDVPTFGVETARSFFDIDTLQVVKGPQGTLFGKNTNGGAILINSKKPTDIVEGYAKARYGNLNDVYLEGAINLPIASGVSLRVAGNLERRDGFTKNDVGPALDSVHYQNLRASLRIAPEGSGVENLTVFNWTNSDETGLGYIVSQVIAKPAILGGGTMSANPLAALTAAQARGPRAVSRANPGFSYVRAYGLTNTTTVDLNDSLVLKNIVGYHMFKYDGKNDYTNSDLGGINYNFLAVDFSRHGQQFTEELQLQGKFMDGRLNTIVGGYYGNNKEDPLGAADSRTPTGATSRGYIFYPNTPALFINQNINNIRIKSKALFAQADFKVTDKLSLTAGYRYTWDDEVADGKFSRTFAANGATVCTLPASVPVPDARFTVNLPNCFLSGKGKWSAGNYTLSANYKPSDDVMLYVAHRHGYKSGGVNTTGGFYGAEGIFGPEKVNDVEAGIKTSGYLGDMRFQLNASAFHSWYDGLQVTQVIVFVVPSTTGGAPTVLTPSLTQNVAKARLWGGELEMSLEPTKGLTLSGNLNYFKGKLVNGKIRLDSAGGALTDVSGLSYGSLPEIQYTLGASYETDVGGGSKLVASGFYSFTKSYFNTYDQTSGNFIPGYGLISGRIGLNNIAGSGFNVSLFGRNLANKLYTVGVSNGATFGYLSRAYGEPRTFGIEAGYKF